MSDLQGLLRQADRLHAPDLWPDIEAWEPRGPGSSRGRRLAVAALALAVAGTGIALAATAFLGDEERRPATAPAPEVHPRITAEIAAGRFPQEIAVGEGAVWVTTSDGDRWFLARIDPTTNEVTDEIDIADVTDVAVGAGAVWAITYQRPDGWAVARIDPTSRDVTALTPLGCTPDCGASQLVAMPDGIWVSVSTDYPDWGEVVRIDPATSQVISRTRVRGDPRDLVIGEGGVWVYGLTHFSRGAVAGATLYRLDRETGALTATLLEGEIPPLAGVYVPPAIAVGHGHVWTSRQRGDATDIVRIDPATNEFTGIPLPGETSFLPFSFEAGGVWFRGGRTAGHPVIARLDPATMQIDQSVPIDANVLDGGIDPTSQTMWLTTYDDSVIRIDLI
jgi:hypothetical protein